MDAELMGGLQEMSLISEDHRDEKRTGIVGIADRAEPVRSSPLAHLIVAGKCGAGILASRETSKIHVE